MAAGLIVFIEMLTRETQLLCCGWAFSCERGGTQSVGGREPKAPPGAGLQQVINHPPPSAMRRRGSAKVILNVTESGSRGPAGIKQWGEWTVLNEDLKNAQFKKLG